jgi:anti-sigma B factor antagonist
MELVEFQVTSERLEDDACVISVAGDLDLYTIPEFEQALLAADGARAVVVELSECTFLDSTALGILVKAKRNLWLAGTTLFVAGASAAIRRPFELTRLDRAFSFHPSVASALDGATE